jgi:hypothetical protein
VDGVGLLAIVGLLATKPRRLGSQERPGGRGVTGLSRPVTVFRAGPGGLPC